MYTGIAGQSKSQQNNIEAILCKAIKNIVYVRYDRLTY